MPAFSSPRSSRRRPRSPLPSISASAIILQWQVAAQALRRARDRVGTLRALSLPLYAAHRLAVVAKPPSRRSAAWTVASGRTLTRGCAPSGSPSRALRPKALTLPCCAPQPRAHRRRLWCATAAASLPLLGSPWTGGLGLPGRSTAGALPTANHSWSRGHQHGHRRPTFAFIQNYFKCEISSI